MVEIDEMDYILESVYDELIEEGFTEEDVEFGIEQALVQDLEEVTSPAAVASAKMRSGNGNPKRDAGAEARSRMNISSSKPSQETKKPSFKDRLKSAAKNAIIGAGRAVGSMMKKKAQAQKSVGKVGSYIDRAKKLARQGYEQGRGPVEKKTTYRGAGVGRKEKIGEDLVNEQDAAPNEKQMLAKKKQMMLKQQMIDKQRLQMQQQGKLPTGHRTEELSIADQMKISREAAAKRKPYGNGDRERERAAQMRSAAKKVKKDTRTDAERMSACYWVLVLVLDIGVINSCHQSPKSKQRFLWEWLERLRKGKWKIPRLTFSQSCSRPRSSMKQKDAKRFRINKT